MSNENNNLKIVFLSISAFLSIVLLVSGVLLLRQLDTLLGRNNDVDDYYYDDYYVVVEPTSPEEERTIEELPPSDGYTLRRNPTEYQLELFDLLVNTHNQFNDSGSDVDLQDYAEAIVRNFVADFFTLSNKNSRTDIGGLQFISEGITDNFRTSAIDDFYLYLNQYLTIFGSESLPTVVSTEILDTQFGTQIIEIEDDDDDIEEYNQFGYYGYEEEIPGEEVRTIIIDVSWSYANSTLLYINEFQTEAQFVLIEIEDEGVRIFQIEVAEEECEEYDYWGNCISVEECEEYDYWGNCISVEECEEYDYWGNCIIDPYNSG